MEQHKDSDEREYGVRPDIVLDMTPEDSDWLRDRRRPEPEKPSR